MAVIVKGPDSNYVYGYIEVAYAQLTSVDPRLLSIPEFVLIDLATVPPTSPYPLLNWQLYWKVNLFTFQFNKSISRFKSALPKFNLGYFDVCYQGCCVESCFWNFQSQGTHTFICWATKEQRAYPSPGYFPGIFPVGNGLYAESLFGSISNNNFADSIYLQLESAVDDSVFIGISYYALPANFSGSPIYFGDF